jgi:hypothetical protein
MIALIGASAIYLLAGQAAINAPRSAFTGCLKQIIEKAQSEKVGGDGYDAYARKACGNELSSLRGALIGFDMKNGMSRKDSGEDADVTINDYMTSAVDHYKYVLGPEKPAPAAAAAAAASPAVTPATPAPTPAASPTQPPRP